MRLDIANVIQNEAILPITTAVHTTPTQTETKNSNASATEVWTERPALNGGNRHTRMTREREP